MNIILCIIDTLRYDYIGASGVNSWIQTPNIDRLAAKSILFERTFSASYPTIPHRTDVMTGAYAWEGQGPFHPWMPLRFDAPSLPRLLAQAGYGTQLIHDTPHLVNGGHAFDWPFAAWSFIRGAEVDRPWIDTAALAPLSNWAHDALFDFIHEEELTGGIKRLLLTYARANRHRRDPEDWNAAQLFTKAADFLKENRQRKDFFLWLDCFDPHEPWDSPPDYVRLYADTPGYDGRIDPRAFYPGARKAKDGVFPPGVFNRQRALYAAKVSWMDHCFGKVLDALEETGLADNTAILFTADHGTNLGERGGFGKTGIVNEQEGHVPFLLYVPGIIPGRHGSIVQPQDIFSTILSIAGVTPPDEGAGSDLTTGTRTGRTIALSGRSIDSWQGDPQEIVMTAFDAEGYLNIAADPEACRLFRYGSVENVAAQHSERVKNLREEVWDELLRRDTNPAIIDWLAGSGTGTFPSALTRGLIPAGWYTYWENVFEG